VKLKALTYTSWARPGIRPEEVESILNSARVNNPLDGITGVLIFNGAIFMQVIEGSEPAIDKLIAELEGDPRHSNLVVRDERMIEARAFPDWSMAYLRLENGQFEGEEQVTRALSRDVPITLRNIIRGLTHHLAPTKPPA